MNPGPFAVIVALVMLALALLLAPSSYLTARRGAAAHTIKWRTLSGSALIAAYALLQLANATDPGLTQALPASFLYLMLCLGASMVLSALPYWLVRLARPSSPAFDRLDATVGALYEPEGQSPSGSSRKDR